MQVSMVSNASYVVTMTTYADWMLEQEAPNPLPELIAPPSTAGRPTSSIRTARRWLTALPSPVPRPRARFTPGRAATGALDLRRPGQIVRTTAASASGSGRIVRHARYCKR